MNISCNKMPSRWITLFVGCVMFLFTGIIYAWSIFSGPFRADFGWNSAQLGLNFTLIMACFCTGGLIGSKVSKYTSVQITIYISAALCLIGYIICSFISAENIIVLYFSYGIMIGIGVGMSYNAVLGTIVSRFKDKKGIATGTLLMGFGCSTLIMGNLAEFMFNSEIGWRNTYRIVGAVIFITLVIGSRFMVTEKEEPIQSIQNQDNETKNYTTAQMLKTTAFWEFFLIVALSNMIGTGVIGHSSYIAQEAGVAAILAPLVVGIQSVCNGLGRIVIGTVLDKFGRKIAMFTDAMCFTLACIMMIFSLNNENAFVGITALLIVGFAYGGMPTLTSSVTAECFGIKHYTENFGISNMSMLPASLGASIIGTIQTRSGSYNDAFVFFIGVIFAVFILNFIFAKHSQRL